MYIRFIIWFNPTASSEAPVAGEDPNEHTRSIKDAKPALGMILFTIFVLYGFAYPIHTRLGCCGKWKPKDQSTDDPSTAYSSHNLVTKKTMIEEVKKQLLSIKQKKYIIIISNTKLILKKK